VVITSKSKSVEEAVFYSNKTIENNWSRSNRKIMQVKKFSSKLLKKEKASASV